MLNAGRTYLATVGTRASVGHGEDAGSGVLQFEVLVLELMAVNRLAPYKVARNTGDREGDMSSQLFLATYRILASIYV